MNERAQSLSWNLNTALFGVAVLALVLLILAGALPVEASLQSRLEAITNPQKAAILGGQQLLQLEQIAHSIYLPITTR